MGVSLDEVSFSLDGDDDQLLYVDNLGYVFPFQSDAESVDELCGNQCAVSSPN